jgi:GNAT superfamily N-acetyltransferase
MPRSCEADEGVLAASSLATEIRQLVPSELCSASKLLALVFDDDPWLRWVYRTAEQRRQFIEWNIMSYFLIYSALDSGRLSNIWGAWSGDCFVSVCFYVEPAAPGNEDHAACFFESFKSVCDSLSSGASEAINRRFLYIERECFGGPLIKFRGDCYYLFLLGCDPAYRGLGLASLHVRSLMDLAFSRGYGVYLDTFNDEAHDHCSFYRRFGFVPLHRSVLPGQEMFADTQLEREEEQQRCSVVNETLVAWPTLQCRINHHRVAAATALPVAHTDAAAIACIGVLRCSVWRAEGPFSCRSDSWTDEYDSLPTCYHWVILDHSATRHDFDVVACARLTFHAGLDDHRDIKIFTDYAERSGRPLRFPVADLGRLVVSAPFRCRGYAQQLNRIRIQAAKDLGCSSIVVTASTSNANLLQKLGFVQLMQDDSSNPVTVTFDDRPSTIFYALLYVFN